MEAIKGYHLLRAGARQLIISRHSNLSGDVVEKVLDRLFERCRDPSNADELTACVHQNMDSIVEEVLGG